MPTYRSASGSVAEDLFIDLFSEAFGAEKAGYLYGCTNYYNDEKKCGHMITLSSDPV